MAGRSGSPLPPHSKGAENTAFRLPLHLWMGLTCAARLREGGRSPQGRNGALCNYGE